MYTYNNQPIDNQAWQHESGKLYLKDWILELDTPEKRTEAGIVEVAEPEPQAPQLMYKTQFTSLEYLGKFTEAEQLAVVSATLQNAQIKLWYDKMLAASYVDITDPRTIGGLDALIQFGLLAASRKEEILTPELITADL